MKKVFPIAVLACVFALYAAPAAAFCGATAKPCSQLQFAEDPQCDRCHRDMTLEALSFMRPQIQLEILSGNLHMDEDSGGHYQYLAPHFDGCDFAGAGEEIK